MSTKVLILGAGFGGLELSSLLTEALGDQVEITLIDKNDGFVFGFSKFDLMFGKSSLDDVTFKYADLAKPTVDFRQETITAIDPASKSVTTDKGSYSADYMVCALGADYNFAATPGLLEGGNEFYSVPGAIALNPVLEGFTEGQIVIGILGQPFKCPPAPWEAAILLDEWYRKRGLRDKVGIRLVSQWNVPIPPSPEGSKAIVKKIEEIGVDVTWETVINQIDPATSEAVTTTGERIPFDLFLGVPVHKVPDVVEEAGLSENDWVPVSEKSLETKFPGVYGVGDVTSAPVPKAGVFAESEAKAVARDMVAKILDSGEADPFDGKGACYVEFGDALVGRMDADFLPGRPATAPFSGPSVEVANEKRDFVEIRRKRWLTG